MGGKRGQITVYIIIGIIALIGVSVFLYMRSAKIEAPITYAPTIETIPVEAEPVREFITSCLRKVGEDGLKKIGDYGGYIDLEHMQADYNPYIATESDAVTFSPGSSMVVPYWWYMKSPNNCDKAGGCSFSTKRPNLLRGQGGTTIEEQLDEYVNNNLRACLRDFVDFSEYGFEVSEAGDVDTKTVVTQESVAFHVKYPLVASRAGVSYRINEYFVDIPLNLKEIYELAKKLADLEAEYAYLDYYIKSLISIFSSVDENKLPPFHGTGFDTGGGVTWRKSDVREMLIQMLTAYIPSIKVANTRNYRFVDFPEGTPNRNAKLTLFNNMNLVPLVEEGHANLEVYFSYLDWGETGRTYFDLDPCRGEICGPESIEGVGSMFSFFLQRYPFNYDISIPILVNIVNPVALNARGYSFKFFMEANIRNNRPVAENITVPEAVNLIIGSTMVCDENKRNSPEFTLELVDARSGTPVEGAFVQFTCGGERCSMGETDINGKFTSRYPVCIGGLLEVTKEGYFGASLPFNTNMNHPFEDRVFIQPFRYKDIEVRKLELRKNCVFIPVVPGDESENTTECIWELYNGTLPFWQDERGERLTLDEEATVMLEKLPGVDGKSGFATVAEFTGDRSLDDQSEDIRILPGVYNIEIFMINREAFNITHGVGLSDPIMFNERRPFFSGGVKLYNVSLAANMIDENDIIVFYALSVELGDVPEDLRDTEDIQQVNSVEDYSVLYRSILTPTYKKREAGAGGRGGTFVI